MCGQRGGGCGERVQVQVRKEQTFRNTNRRVRPCMSGLPPRDPVVAVSAGHWHTLCVTAAGELWAFGGNNQSQCGLGKDSEEVIRQSPTGRLPATSSNTLDLCLFSYYAPSSPKALTW